MNSESDRKLAYSLLNKNEKYSIWKSKMENLLNDDLLFGVKVKLNDNQRSLISEFNEILKPSLFSDEDNDRKEYIKNIYVPNFISRAKDVFDDKYLIGMIFYEITVTSSEKLKNSSINYDYQSLINSFNSRADDFIISETKDCNCQKDSFFSCAWGQHETYCKKKKCKDSLDGCGFAGWYECEQICELI